MAITMKEGELLKCPHCGEELDPVQDFVVPGKIGFASRGEQANQCGNCDGYFVVEANRDGTFWVEQDEDAEDGGN